MCTLLNVENISSRKKSSGLGSHFCQQNEHISVKKMNFSNIAQVKYSIVAPFTSTSTFSKLVNSVKTSRQPTRAENENTKRGLKKIKNDCDQETGKEYSTIVQIIAKDDRGKALA